MRPSADQDAAHAAHDRRQVPALHDAARDVRLRRRDHGLPAKVPTIVIDFPSPGFPSLAGRPSTLTMSDVNGNVVSTQTIIYESGGHVEILYPGTSVNPDGSIADVPGWNLTNAGLWVRDPTDEFLRDGIHLSLTVNPTATAEITYPPESSACANRENPPGAPPGSGIPPALGGNR